MFDPIPGFEKPTSGEEMFLDQMTRSLMVDWCHQALTNGTGIPVIPEDHGVYQKHAVAKKWLSAKDLKILSAGWKTGAAFLKR